MLRGVINNHYGFDPVTCTVARIEEAEDVQGDIPKTAEETYLKET